jgi:thymidine kinase
MLTCYTGVMGAGKTYRMVARIKDDFQKNGLVLTNINGIKETDTIKHFDFILHDFKHYDPNPDSFNQSASPFETLIRRPSRRGVD